MPPGDYTATLKVGDAELSQPFTVIKPAGVDVSNPDLAAQYDLSLRISKQLDRTAKTINRMRDVRAQLDGLAKRTKERDGVGEIPAAAEEIRVELCPICGRAGLTVLTLAPACSKNCRACRTPSIWETTGQPTLLKKRSGI